MVVQNENFNFLLENLTFYMKRAILLLIIPLGDKILEGDYRWDMVKVNILTNIVDGIISGHTKFRGNC